MKYPKNKKNNRGVSIVEIVVSMIIIMLVMLVLAFVYPNGRRLTNSSDNRTKATAIAKSILEE
ncbi:prepilin-type N-terminal cleavage/methylation domain-containing protein, partial [bacterium]|nr:prepilin-type N-terminal cleavage/methylation domain-containing protein [bacterium]